MFDICCVGCGDVIAHTPSEDVSKAVTDNIYCDDCVPESAGDEPDEDPDGSENAEETQEEKEG